MKSSTILEQADVIRSVFAYAARFKERIFVFHLDTDRLEDELLNLLVKDLVLLHQAGIRIVLVPAARNRIDEVLARYSVSWKRHEGVRIAGADTIPFIKMAAFDVTNRLMTLLSAMETNAVVGNWVRARGMGVVGGIDYEHAGVVERIQLDLLRTTLEQGTIPIFPCIGWSVSGKPYNISSRELAYRIAVSLEAAKLFFVTDGVRIAAREFNLPAGAESEEEDRISRLTVSEAKAFLELNGGSTVSTGEPDQERPSGYFDDSRSDQLELLRLAYNAANSTVDRVHIIDGRRQGAVLAEIFSTIGVGTMVHANQYESIRPLRSGEVSEVYRLMEPLAERGILIARSEEDINRRYEDYVVHETDGRLHGCGALHEYRNGSAEIAAIAVDPAYEQLGIGRRIVLYLIEEARRRKLREVFVLTTRTFDWFESIGFRRVGIEALPEEKRRRYDTSRNSVILRYALK